MVTELETFWTLVDQVLRLQTGAIETLAAVPAGGRLALALVLLVGLSEALGESVVLFVNRVSPRRFVLSLFISAVLFAFTYAFWTLSIYLVAHFAFDAQDGLWLVARVVGFSYAPRLFGFLALIPYFGMPIHTILQLWSLLAVLLGVGVALELRPWQALASVALGAVLLALLQVTVGRPIVAIARWIRSGAAGVSLVTDRRRLRELIDTGPDQGLRGRRSGSRDEVAT